MSSLGPTHVGFALSGALLLACAACTDVGDAVDAQATPGTTGGTVAVDAGSGGAMGDAWVGSGTGTWADGAVGAGEGGQATGQPTLEPPERPSAGEGGDAGQGSEASFDAGAEDAAYAPDASDMTFAGTISLSDEAPGFASEAGGTLGGGRDLAGAVSVSSMTELTSAARGDAPAVILVQPGTYRGQLQPGANKTIVGVSPGVKLLGSLKISGADRSNIIVRNLAIQGEPCSSYQECKDGADAVYVGNDAHHVWLDHLDVSDGQDGNCDITQGGDYVTVSWTRFYYTYAKEHRFSNLIAGSDNEPKSVGKLRITYMLSHWGDRVDQRQPRGRFGNIHMLNNYHRTGGSQIHGVGFDMAMIAEGSVYEEGISIWKDMGNPRGYKGVGNIGSGKDLNASFGSVFEVPYAYDALPASEVVAAVTSPQCGAGNTCELAR